MVKATAIFAVLLIVASPAILAYQTLRWLETAIWLHINLNSVMGEPFTRWLGVQRIIDWFWSLPLSILLPVFGGLILFSLMVEADERRRKKD